MNIPKFWARGSSARQPSAVCWKWSNTSLADAQRQADARAGELAQMLDRGVPLDRYLYGDRPLREETVESIVDEAGTSVAVVTRNLYGALVLNTAGVMFIDIDFAEKGSGAGLFGRLFGKARPADPQQQGLEQLQAWAAGQPGLGLRIYRTCAGLRCMVTNRIFDPSAPETIELLRSAGSDPLYVRLCQAQACFRARLTPKPWRCGQSMPTARYPWISDKDESRFRQWQAGYEKTTARFSVCRPLAELGPGALHPHIEQIISVHDRFTCGKSGQPLA
jgi:hypothetical protein